VSMREPFPLQWPDGWKRTTVVDRARSRFGFRGQVSFSQARTELLLELERLGAANVVLTSDLPVRSDGLPYANGRADDPGIAVWFLLPDERGNMQERVFACDKWRTHAENMTAIARSVEAMRGLDRWGAGDVVTRAFAGFNALPPGNGESAAPQQPVKRSWREVFSIAKPLEELSNSELLALVYARHRAAIKTAHPDAGGSHEVAAELNAAMADAEAELQPKVGSGG
jgi:hypothetical protein